MKGKARQGRQRPAAHLLLVLSTCHSNASRMVVSAASSAGGSRGARVEGGRVVPGRQAG